MNRIIFNYINFGFLLLLIAVSCSDDQQDVDPMMDPEIEPKVLSIAGVDPIIGPPGIEVTISGTGFENLISANRVTFGIADAVIISANDSVLVTKVPENASTGTVNVVVGEQSAEGPTFTVTPLPKISGFEPQEGSIRTFVSISGENFFAVEGENNSLGVKFNGIEAEIKSRSADEIEVVVPSEASTGTITVSLRGLVLEAGIFSVTDLQLIYNTEVAVTSVKDVEDLSNVFVTSSGDVLLSTNTQILQLNSDSSIEIIAGIDGNSSYSDGPVSSATFGDPYQIVEDSNNDLLVSDIQNKAIRKIANEEVTTYYSNSDFFVLLGIAIDNSNNLFISDFTPKIWKLSPELALTAFAEFPAVPQSVKLLALDSTENIYALAENQVLKITKSGTVSNFAGSESPGIIDGPGNEARFNFPLGIAVGPDGYVYIADSDNYLIRKISPEGMVTTVCGLAVSDDTDGDVNSAKFRRPTSIAFNQMGNLLLVDNEETLRLIELK